MIIGCLFNRWPIQNVSINSPGGTLEMRYIFSFWIVPESAGCPTTSRVLPFGLLFLFLSLTTTTFSLTKFMECHRVADGAQFMSLRFIQFLPVAVPFLFYFNTIRLEWANYNPLATIHNSKNVTAEGNLILLIGTLVQVVVDSSASTVIFAGGVQCPKFINCGPKERLMGCHVINLHIWPVVQFWDLWRWRPTNGA